MYYITLFKIHNYTQMLTTLVLFLITYLQPMRAIHIDSEVKPKQFPNTHHEKNEKVN